ncbi:MAG: O-antigen ligase family protein [Candidatus Omnitrophota bacterium]|nr:O-antigen ligase family protein [Candidatus Omnitrophota bacterium]
MPLNIGLGILIFLLPFSPHIPIKLLGSSFSIRFEDIIVPILLCFWISELLLKKRRFIYSGLYIPIGAYFFIGLISTFLGYYVKHIIPDPLYAACVILRSAEYYIIFCLTVNILKTKKQLINYFNVWLVAAVLIALYGILDCLFNVSGPTGLYDRGWFSFQSNHLGGYLMISLILAIGLFSTAANKTQKILSVIAIPLISYVLFFSLSRITYLSTFVAILVYCILKSKRLILVPLILAFFLFWIIPKMMPDTLVGRYLNSAIKHTFSLTTVPQSLGSSIASDFSAAQHRFLIKRAFKITSQHPFIGEGLGAREIVYYDSQLALVPASTGIIGSTIFLWLLIAIWRIAISRYRNTTDTYLREVARVFLAIFAGLLVHSIASVAFLIAVIAYPFWFLTGAVFSLKHLS